MATVNLGRIKPVFRGAYSGSTAYVVDDIVTSGNETYICIQAHGAGTQAVTQTAYWTKLAAKGTDGTDVGTTITTQGDILYRDGSGLARLAAGTSGQYLETKGAGQNPVWSTVSSGAYSVAEFNGFNIGGETHAGSANTAYPVGGSNAVAITATATSDLLHFMYATNVEGQQGVYYGQAIGMQTANSSWTSSTSHSSLVMSLGEHAQGMGSGNDTERYQHLEFNITVSASDLGMSAGTQYYFKPFILVHSPGGQIKTGLSTANTTTNGRGRFTIMRYTSNS